MDGRRVFTGIDRMERQAKYTPAGKFRGSSFDKSKRLVANSWTRKILDKIKIEDISKELAERDLEWRSSF